MTTKNTLAILLCALLPLSSHAQAPEDTLQRIKSGAPVKVGYRAAGTLATVVAMSVTYPPPPTLR